MSIRADEALHAYEGWRTRRVSKHTWAGEYPGLCALTEHLLATGVGIDEVRPEHLESWWWSLELADSTRHTRLSQLRRYFRFCIETQHWLHHDPTGDLIARKPMPEPRERLTTDQLLLMLDAAPYPQHRVVLALAENLALRAQEIRGLRVRDYQGDRIRVRVDKTRQVDDMPVTRELASELRSWLSHYRASAGRPVLGSHFLVPSQYVSTIQRRVIYRPDRPIAEPEDIVKRALEQLGWAAVKGEGVHTIRRSVARIFYETAAGERGENDALLATMRLLHHTKPTTTLTYIGIDKQTEVRDDLLLGKTFLTRAGARHLSIAQ